MVKSVTNYHGNLKKDRRIILLMVITGIFIYFFSSPFAYAQKSEWIVISTFKNSRLEVKNASITKVQNSLVFDGLMKIQLQDGTYAQSIDRYIVSCNGKSVAPLSRVPMASSEAKERIRWLEDRDTTILSNTTSLVVDTAFTDDYWFMTQSFREKIQSWCKTAPKGLKNIEASIASSGMKDAKVETYVLLLDSIKSYTKYREIWTATYEVNKKPVIYTDPATGEKTHIKFEDKPQYERSPVGTANSRGRYRFQCNEKKIALVQSVIYSQTGVVSDSRSLTELEINKEWTEVIPSSIGETLLEFVCVL